MSTNQQFSPAGLNRRNLFAAPALLGAALAPAQMAAQTPEGSNAAAARASAAAAVNAVYTKARELMYPTCRVCPECDGVACAGESRGIGGIGSGLAFQNNYRALQRVHVCMRTLTNVTRPDTSTTLFGQKLSFPAVGAPMGSNSAGFGKGMPADAFFDAIIGGCNDAGTVGAVGESPASAMAGLKSRLDIVARYHGRAVYGVKPASNAAILKLAPMIEAAGAFMVTIDVDSAGRYNRNAPPEASYGPKSVAELKELAGSLKMPLLIKGIMTPDEAELAVEAGAAGIVVSNHGGRVLDHTPGTVDVLPAIAARVKGKTVILVDGCIHYGVDVLKCVALGADAVMVGRHILRAAYGGGREGVALFMNTMREEFERAMVLTGVSSVSAISRRLVA
jgi:4-hydroxymandelate oxidase